MHTYTSIVFTRYEQSILKTASLHLGVGFPEVHTEMPRKRSERIPDHDARIVLALLRDPTFGTHENICRALAVMEQLAVAVERESALDYWLDDTEREKGVRPEPSDDPTSGYMVLKTLADIRAGQLVDVNAALPLLRQAAHLTTPRPDSRELDETDSEFD